MMDTYNQEVERLKQEPTLPPDLDAWVNNDERAIKWNRGLREELVKGRLLTFDPQDIVVSSYRPFCKQLLYFKKEFNDMQYLQKRLFPTPQHKNLVICFSNTKTPTVLITDCLPDLHYIGDSQCFPLYWYEEEKPETVPASLFGEPTERRWVQRSGISDWMLREVRSRFGNTRALTREDIFYYIYGVLHSEEYRTRFADDLRKALPRIPIVECLEDFMAFSRAGRQLAEMHLHYENYKQPEEEQPAEQTEPNDADKEWMYDHYRVEKMSWPNKGDRSVIAYNEHVVIEGIPKRAYDYIVNGKSAIEWIMERYAVTTDKKSGITNDPNLWCREQGNPRYIVDLLHSVIRLSTDTMEIVRQLPSLALPPRTDE